MSARPDTWMPMYWGDYARDTGHLNAAGHGAYLMLIKHYWCTGAPLTDDDDELWRVACCDSKKEWLSIRARVVRLFKAENGLLRHKRIDKEIASASEAVSAKAKAGKKGADARWQGNGKPKPLPSSGDANANGKRIADASDRHDFANAPSPSPSPSKLSTALDDLKLPATPFPELAAIATEEKSGRPIVGDYYLDRTQERVFEAARIDNARWQGDIRPLVSWLADGIEPDTIVAVISKRAGQSGYEVPHSLKYFDKPVREAHGKIAA